MTVHGGIGEDGTLQALLEDEGVAYTGSLQLMVQRYGFSSVFHIKCVHLFVLYSFSVLN